MGLAIITGGSSGIGEALGRELHSRGWAVGLIARREDRLRTICDELGASAAWATADVADEASVQAAVHQLEQVLGPCDLMVANAGVGESRRAVDLTAERLNKLMRVNFDGVVFSTLSVLPGMVSRGRGQIAVVSSVAGFRGLPGSGLYSASKAGISTLFEAWRIELAPKGIAVTSIHPGFVESEMTAKNRFSMPFLMTSERAARIMATGLERRRKEINFPLPMVALMTLVRWMPNWLYDRVMGKARA